MLQVWNIINELGLSTVAHCFIGDSYTRGLSGGEKRRVSIACELLTLPSLLFLDEPTTGLDSTNAARVVDIMASQATAGITIVMSIHQPRPDIFRLMDRLLLLSGQGQVVFSGPVSYAASHLAGLDLSPPGPTVPIADYLLDMVIRSSTGEVNQMVNMWKSSAMSHMSTALASSLADAPLPLPPRKFSASFVEQLTALAGRLLRNTYRHPFLVVLNFGATLAAAVGLGVFFRNAGTDTAGIQNRLGVLFFMLLYLSLMSLSCLPVWRDDKLLFLRERGSGLYNAPAYFTAVVIPPVFFALFSYPAIGLHPTCSACILWFVWTLIVANVTSASMCMAIGAAAPSNTVANMVGSLTVMLLLLFGGFLLNKDKIPVYCKWISSTSFFNYAYEALAVNEFHHFPADFTSGVLPPLRITGDVVHKEFGFDSARFYVDSLLLMLLTGNAAGRHTTTRITGDGVLKEFGFDSARFYVDSLLLVLLGLVCGLIAFACLALSGGSLLNEVSVQGSHGMDSLVSAMQSAVGQMKGSKEEGGVQDDGDGGGQAAHTRPLLDEINGDIPQSPVAEGVTGIAGPTPAAQPGSPRMAMSSSHEAGAGGLLPSSSTPRGSCLFAILGPSGPSGAGENQRVLDMLSDRRCQGRAQGISGEVRIDGHLMAPHELGKVSGCVQQDIILPGTSTVAEYLAFHASLRMKAGLSKQALHARVTQTVSRLSLDKVFHSLTGDAFVRGLSGGEKRRVSIACELLTLPGLLFLDEPTTGLDSTNAARVVDIMASLATAGVTIVMSIHQPRPDIFRLMDRLLLLSGQGQYTQVFATDRASLRHAMGHQPPSESISIADHVLDVVIKSNPSEVDLLVAAFSRSEQSREDGVVISELQMLNAMMHEQQSSVLKRMKKYEASYTAQVHALSARLMRNSLRHPLLFLLAFVATALMALGVGAVYWDTGRDTGGIQPLMALGVGAVYSDTGGTRDRLDGSLLLHVP
eukprot:gene20669-27459_t